MEPYRRRGGGFLRARIQGRGGARGRGGHRLTCPGCGSVAARFRFDLGHDHTLPLFECPHCRLIFAPAPQGDRERHGATYHAARSHQVDAREAAAHAALMLSFWARRLKWNGRERMLEVGCAEGILLQVAGAMHYRVRGIDISPYYVPVWNERGLPATVSTLEDYSREHPDPVDVVIARQLFEHLSHPHSFLQACAAILTPGGACLIETCDSHSLEARVLGRRWAFWEPAEGLGAHVSFLNPWAAERMGAKAGLRFVASVPYAKYRRPPDVNPLSSAAALWRWAKYRAHRTRLSGGKCYLFRKPLSSGGP